MESFRKKGYLSKVSFQNSLKRLILSFFANFVKLNNADNNMKLLMIHLFDKFYESLYGQLDYKKGC